MPDFVVVFLLSALECLPVRIVVYTLVFADRVPVLTDGGLVPCFVELRIVWLLVAEGRCS